MKKLTQLLGLVAVSAFLAGCQYNRGTDNLQRQQISRVETEDYSLALKAALEYAKEPIERVGQKVSNLRSPIPTYESFYND